MNCKHFLTQCRTQLVRHPQCGSYFSTSSLLHKEKKDVVKPKDPSYFKGKTPAVFLDPSLATRAQDLKQSITIDVEPDTVGYVSGVPEEHIKTRTVTIYKPAKNAMQSGTNNINYWQIGFDTRERWENPLMGWCSSSDPLQALRVNFETVEEAISHCSKMGWKYIIEYENKNDPKPRTYGANFSWDKRTRASTK